MITATNPVTRADATDVRSLLEDLSALLLKWSWEGVVGYEEMVEKVSRSYGWDDATVMMEAQCATIELDGKVTFVRGGIPGFPPMAYTQNLKDLLGE